MGFANEKGWNKQIFLGYFSNGGACEKNSVKT